MVDENTLGGVSGVILVQARNCSERIIKQERNTGILVQYLMCEYARTQFNNIIKFKNIKKLIENVELLSTISKKHTTNAIIERELNLFRFDE